MNACALPGRPDRDVAAVKRAPRWRAAERFSSTVAVEHLHHGGFVLP
ncbi:hypothetical protein [Lysobacter gummosus]